MEREYTLYVDVLRRLVTSDVGMIMASNSLAGPTDILRVYERRWYGPIYGAESTLV